jgi:acyl-CoA synthetase
LDVNQGRAIREVGVAGQHRVWTSLDEAIRSHAADNPDGWAYIEPAGRMSWAAYDGYVTLLAARLVEAGLEPGDRLGVWLGDGAAVHVALCACLRAGVVAVGIGARSGLREVRHLLGVTGARMLLTEATYRGQSRIASFDQLRTELPTLEGLLLVEETVPPVQGEVTSVPVPAGATSVLNGRMLDPTALSLINSTSGTTGLPKCVAHNQRRWIKYHDYAVDAGDLVPGEMLMSVVPAPFGFGLWTAHFTPTLLGSPIVVLPRFDAAEMVRMLAEERVSVLMAVSTQFILMLAVPDLDEHDLSALRIMYTGGEAVPHHKALEFEQRTGSKLLNMYGSNETGVQSYTTVRDTTEARLTSAGRVIDEVDVRLFDLDAQEIPRGGEPGRPGSRGEVCSLGYYNDGAANRQLFTPGGWMLMGDLVTIDDDGYLRVVGRTSDFIIRGGKNISAPAVEQEVGTHPAVFRCAAVAMPDPVFGERVCIYVVARPGSTVDLDDIVAHLKAREVSREWYPERLILVDDLPTSDGGKLAKWALRADIQRRLSEETVAPHLTP